LTDVDVRIKRLAVTLTRDSGWNEVWYGDAIRDALIYVDAPLDYVQSRSELDYANPINLAVLLYELNERTLLPLFLTQILRTKFTPNDKVNFHAHLQPLGYDWDEKRNQIRPTMTHPTVENEVRNELEALLSNVDSEFPKMLNGAWEAYYSKNPDRYRHAISSSRELLHQVTVRLSNGEKLERKQRVRQILVSKSQADVVEASASLVNAIYGVQSAQEHRKPDSPTALFVLIETEHILYFLLTQKKASGQTS
jgi:hypothetical protein